MGLLDSVAGEVMERIGGSGQAGKLLGGLSGLLGDGGPLGGVQGLVSKLGAGGLGNLVESWVGTGPNKDVSPDQVRQALGDDQVQQVADQAGVSKDEAASGLAALLPQLIDKLSPDGKLPDAGALKEQLGKLLS